MEPFYAAMGWTVGSLVIAVLRRKAEPHIATTFAVWWVSAVNWYYLP